MLTDAQLNRLLIGLAVAFLVAGNAILLGSGLAWGFGFSIQPAFAAILFGGTVICFIFTVVFYLLSLAFKVGVK